MTRTVRAGVGVAAPLPARRPATAAASSRCCASRRRSRSAHGFDGVMTSEHHGGFAGYLPTRSRPRAGCLEAMPAGWAAPCPLLLPLRPAALVAEEVAWLAARFPGRVGLGVAAGALADDFAVMGLEMGDKTERFADGLALVAAALSGRASGVVTARSTIQRCADQPVPVLSAAMGVTAAQRAAACGVGLLFDSLTAPAAHAPDRRRLPRGRRYRAVRAHPARVDRCSAARPRRADRPTSTGRSRRRPRKPTGRPSSSSAPPAGSASRPRWPTRCGRRVPTR